MSRKIIVTVVAITIFFTMLGLLLRPGVSIELEGDIDPSVVQVRIDDTILGPGGSGGSLYTAKVFPGPHTVSVKGQSIETYEQRSFYGFGTKRITVKPAVTELEEVVKTAFGEENINVKEVRYFEKKWLIANIENLSKPNKDGSTEYPVILRYNVLESRWELASAEIASWVIEMPIEARRYFDSISED